MDATSSAPVFLSDLKSGDLMLSREPICSRFLAKTYFNMEIPIGMERAGKGKVIGFRERHSTQDRPRNKAPSWRLLKGLLSTFKVAAGISECFF